MTAVMQDNPKAQSGESHRRKIIETFEINLGRCIICGICVDVCNLDAIVMSHEHEKSAYMRNDNRVDLGALLEMGRKHQEEEAWEPTAPERNHAETVLAVRKERENKKETASENDSSADSQE
jgi:formate hydrogenlyase subunit 6/NADH:ubiquinone oxidoreductase subunit I